jgi:hypothetical protein
LRSAFIIVIPPPAVPGIGTGGGFTSVSGSPGPRFANAGGRDRRTCYRRAQGSASHPDLLAVLRQHAAGLRRHRPRQGAEARRSIAAINDTIQTYFGSTYVNDFNLFSRTYHVTGQADLQYRKESSDLTRLRTRNANGDMVMLGSVVDFPTSPGRPCRAIISMQPPSCRASRRRAQGSTTAIDIMKQLADETLPSDFTFEWTDLAYQQVTGGNSGTAGVPICVLFVYLVLAAQYGSWSLPFAVILIVPMCLLRHPRRPHHGAGRQYPPANRFVVRWGCGKERHPDRRICARRASSGRSGWRLLSRPAACGCGRS